ncbi:MAG: DUF3800 domain-containing protein [Candidatus Latescibacteria bacterium]|nr:DUF3800 domain-containing protein [Candidatus Latescibacterota bacterium]
MKYGFLDEAGDVGYTERATSTFIVAVVVVGNPEKLRKATERVRRIWRRHLRGASELKASRHLPRITGALLRYAMKVGFDAVAVVVDKSKASPPADPEELYRRACARAVEEALERFGSLSLTLDRRYTSMRLQELLEKALSAPLDHLAGKALAFHYQDSQRERALQVADAVAWTLFQKHERKDETAWRIIQGQVVEVRL